MTWLQRYRIRHYLANSIWIFPLLSMAAAIGAGRLLRWIDQTMGWQSDLHPDTVQVVLGTLASSMFTFIVFIFVGAAGCGAVGQLDAHAAHHRHRVPESDHPLLLDGVCVLLHVHPRGAGPGRDDRSPIERTPRGVLLPGKPGYFSII